jgi:hypothetical protein
MCDVHKYLKEWVNPCDVAKLHSLRPSATKYKKLKLCKHTVPSLEIRMIAYST